MSEVVPGIYQLKIPLPNKAVLLGYVNVYLARGQNGHLLIDTGWGMKEAFDSLVNQLADIGIDIKSITQIVSTHIHPDHYGLAGRLNQLYGARFMLHRLETTLVKQRYVAMEALLEQVSQWLHMNGVPEKGVPELTTASVGLADFVSPAEPDIPLSGGEMISTGLFNFRVIWTPGHSPGHVCLYEPEKKILISGDHILPTITPNIGLHPQYESGNPLGDYINALKDLKKLDIKLVLPGHEMPFTNLNKRVDELLEHHRQRCSDALSVMDSKPRTAYQIATHMTWLKDIGGLDYEKLAPLDKRLAVLETIAHLELLHKEGRVSKSRKDGIVFYQSVN